MVLDVQTVNTCIHILPQFDDVMPYRDDKQFYFCCVTYLPYSCKMLMNIKSLHLHEICCHFDTDLSAFSSNYTE